MRKVVCILLLGLVASGCATARKKKNSVSKPTVSFTGNVMELVKSQNLSATGFFIEKADVTIRENGNEKAATGTVKCDGKGKYLISIKSIAGLEFARIFITSDSIFVNDRIDRKLFLGSSDYLRNKYGISTAFLPVLFGDMIDEGGYDADQVNCEGGKISFAGIIRNSEIKYVVDCSLGKIEYASPERKFDQNSVEIYYGQFNRLSDVYYPAFIQVREKQGNNVIDIEIKRITYPWKGDIGFVPGKYEKVILK